MRRLLVLNEKCICRDSQPSTSVKERADCFGIGLKEPVAKLAIQQIFECLGADADFLGCRLQTELSALFVDAIIERLHINGAHVSRYFPLVERRVASASARLSSISLARFSAIALLLKP